MDGLIVGAIILGVFGLVIFSMTLIDYQTVIASIAREEQAMKDGTYGSSSPIRLPLSLDDSYFRFGVSAALGASGFGVYFVNRTIENNHNRSQLPDA